MSQHGGSTQEPDRDNTNAPLNSRLPGPWRQAMPDSRLTATVKVDECPPHVVINTHPKDLSGSTPTDMRPTSALELDKGNLLHIMSTQPEDLSSLAIFLGPFALVWNAVAWYLMYFFVRAFEGDHSWLLFFFFILSLVMILPFILVGLLLILLFIAALKDCLSGESTSFKEPGCQIKHEPGPVSCGMVWPRFSQVPRKKRSIDWAVVCSSLCSKLLLCTAN
jgi:hypothetical protein